MNHFFAKPHKIFIILGLIVENSTRMKKGCLTTNAIDTTAQKLIDIYFSIHELHYIDMQIVKVNCVKFITIYFYFKAGK